ncbi:Neprosin domain-containing protein [Psidium guajava]|nr:Neprosin domain-containing protein [Psidium guajava]
MALKLLLGFLIFCGVYIVCGKTSLLQDDLDLERQLKTMNKPPIKTFVTKEGETIDCIDINRQPSLDHPLLKNHKIQRKPSPHIVNSPTSSSTGNSKLVAFRPREPCPAGTVPIPRVRKEDLIRARSLLKNPSSFVRVGNDDPSHHLVSILVDDVETKYGVDAHMSVYNLTPVVEDQFSAHRFHPCCMVIFFSPFSCLSCYAALPSNVNNFFSMSLSG